jgi:hypothetical protein
MPQTGVYNERDERRQRESLRYKREEPIIRAKESGFPNCKGLYPDCPEKPSKNHPMCRTCPVLDEED